MHGSLHFRDNRAKDDARALSQPDAPKPDHARADRFGDKTAMMPLRTTTRAQNRAHRITAERQHNKLIRERVSEQGQRQEIPVTANDQPPPF
jgi:hypothetical protein